MRKNLKKLALPALAAAGAVLGAWHSASADLIVTASAATNSGGFDVYVLSVINDTTNGSGNNLLGMDTTITMQTPGFIRSDESASIDGDGINDANPYGVGKNGGGVTTVSFGENLGTWMQVPGGVTKVSDVTNGVLDSTTFPTYSSYTTPGAPTAIWNQLTKLQIVETANLLGNGQPDKIVRPFMNVVIPHGGTATATGSTGGSSGPQFPFSLTLGGSVSTAPTFPIVLLKSAAPSNTGALMTNPASGAYTSGNSTLTVTGSGGAYAAGFIYNLTPGPNGAASGYTQTGGFSGGDLEIYLLNLKIGGADPTLAQEQTIINDINNPSAGNTGIVAKLVSATLTGLGGVVNPWDIEIDIATPGGNQNGFFGFNFAGETNVAGVTVHDIAAVPEPATAGLLLVGGIGLLAKRRRASK